MHLLSHTAIVALLAVRTLGHPAPPSSSVQSIQKRTVNLLAYKLGVGSEYVNNVVITEQGPVFKGFVAPSYTDTATYLVKSVFPEAEFRLLSSYRSSNGMGHVVFKQILHGIDIDTADFNVNVSLR